MSSAVASPGRSFASIGGFAFAFIHAWSGQSGSGFVPHSVAPAVAEPDAVGVAGFPLALVVAATLAEGAGAVSLAAAVAEAVADSAGGALAVAGVAVLSVGAVVPDEDVDSVLVHPLASATRTTTDVRRSSMATQLTRMR